MDRYLYFFPVNFFRELYQNILEGNTSLKDQHRLEIVVNAISTPQGLQFDLPPLHSFFKKVLYATRPINPELNKI